MDVVEIIVKATGDLAAWLWGQVNIVITATPSLGGLSPLMVMSGFALVLFGGWQIMGGKRREIKNK